MCVCGGGRELLVGMLLFARGALAFLIDNTAVLTPAVLLMCLAVQVICSTCGGS